MIIVRQQAELKSALPVCCQFVIKPTPGRQPVRLLPVHRWRVPGLTGTVIAFNVPDNMRISSTVATSTPGALNNHMADMPGGNTTVLRGLARKRGASMNVAL